MVAACVMTFEARDRAAKFMSNQLKIMGGGGSGGVGGGTISGSHRHGGRQTPSAGGYLSRGDSGRSSYQNPCDGSRHKMNKSPSAPNLAAANRLVAGITFGAAGAGGRMPLRHKHPMHVVSPGGRALLSPHTLRRQAMSVDTQDYNPLFSPPRSRHSSSGLLAGNINRVSSCSRESVNCNDLRVRGSHGSMVLDLHVPNECPVTMRVRDRSRRSDTARRHVLRRQTPVELDDAIIAYATAAAAAAATGSSTDRQQRAKRCTRSATCDVPHVVKSKRRRQDSSSSDVVTRRRSGSPVCANSSSGGGSGGWRSSANDVVDAAERIRTGSGSSATGSPRLAEGRQRAVQQQTLAQTTTQNAVDNSMSLSRTCSDIMSIDKSFEEANYSSS